MLIMTDQIQYAYKSIEDIELISTQHTSLKTKHQLHNFERLVEILVFFSA
jgi:hypothetical protein